MAYLLFIDESGTDNVSPYEVLAGVAIEDKNLWKLIKEIHLLEIRLFGIRYKQSVGDEIKAKKFLKTKVFRLAKQGQLAHLDPFQKSELVKSCLLTGESTTKDELTAMAQAKLDYVDQVLKLCDKYGCKIFASILLRKLENNELNVSYLRKDYIYLFERFFYFLEDCQHEQQGIIVFDELDKTRSYTIINQMDTYFKRTEKGILRSTLVLPEPFFVHSDLTTGVQLADLVAYIISWGLRLKRMTKERRAELDTLSKLVKQMSYITERVFNGEKQRTSSIALIENKKGNASFPIKASEPETDPIQ
ncbi:DUF3800 domain-containing protein [Fibrella aquatilis]|uniref:DUF3800 domain-containing protein n=1 Tax=Fibrella aquatilis TaxID=2817059 RepID=A0A939JVB8_9BACT|nr:DUF3800 domain-containing protein [Fibrella aquatilis]MBO0930682.1 DUF3800 domain-containing protein [Fibrella aquatilis]